LLFPGTLYPLIGTDKKLWFFTMLGISLLVLPFTLLQYFHTRERITEESNSDDAAAPKVPLKKQLSVVFKDRYWWIIIFYAFIFQLGLALKNSSVAYYCNWVIGAKYNDGYTMLAFNLVGGLSLVLGAVVITPLSKKFTKQQLMVFGFIFYALGDLLCFVISYPGWFSLDKNTMLIIVLIGQFIKNAGAIPCVYIWTALIGDVLDHLEAKAGFRVDGITISLMTIFALAMPIIGNAIVNLLLGNFGYVAPNGDASQTQNLTLQGIFDGLAVGSEVISSLIIVALMSFLSVEKNLASEQATILARQKEACLAQGKPWMSPEEKAKKEEAEFNEQTRESDLQALKKKCEKRHLDYGNEVQAYDLKKIKKEIKK
jgi:GPH family glycoside/pentoside/hexuronide:cation symporter